LPSATAQAPGKCCDCSAARVNAAQKFSLACQSFSFSLGVSEEYVPFEMKRGETVKGDDPLISVKVE
jgi:hypothetical protein